MQVAYDDIQSAIRFDANPRIVSVNSIPGPSVFFDFSMFL